MKRSKCTYHPNAYVENRLLIEAYDYFAHERRKQKHRAYNAARKAEKAERFNSLPSRVVPIQVPIKKRTPSIEKLSTNPSSPTSMTNSVGSVASSKSTSLSPVVPGATISKMNINLAKVTNKLYSPPSLSQNSAMETQKQPPQFKTSNSNGARRVSSSENHVEVDDFYKSDSEDDDLRSSGKSLIHSRLKSLQKSKRGSSRAVEIDDDSESQAGPVEVSDGINDDLSSDDDQDFVSDDGSDYDLFNELPVSKKKNPRFEDDSDELERQSRILKELYYEKRDIDEIYTGRRRRRAAGVANYREDEYDESDDSSADGYNDAAERDEMLILSEDEETRRALAGDLPENYFENKEVHLARQREREEKMLRQNSLHVVDEDDDDAEILMDLSD
ncbi:unnamed protein product [Ambrosiozyma monospora]|uniref:Unnamed protein product n=1 Tax=Ambrosiozyma monospora TaxID=43982 RepID=A0A9W7DGB2_AMBMO|nr:unnamed protein product [Ambrosiozyma monospora]